MRSRLAFALAVAALGAGIATAGVSGGVTMTYHGIFTGAVSYASDCTGVPSPIPVADGVWNVAIHRDAATVTINIFTDGRHHVSYGTAATVLNAGPSSFQVEFPTGAGDLVMSLSGGVMTYTIAQYQYGGVYCQTGSVTYHGESR